MSQTNNQEPEVPQQPQAAPSAQPSPIQQEAENQSDAQEWNYPAPVQEQPAPYQQQPQQNWEYQQQPQSQYQQPQYQQPQYQQVPNNGYYPQNPQPPFGYPNGVPMVGTKSKLAAGLFGIFLGGLGVHNFYLGYTGKAVAQILLSTLGIFLIIGPVISGIWALVEGILILASSTGSSWHRDAQGFELRD